LYDGVCALCNGLVRAVLRFDRKAEFRFASLQGHYARETLTRHQKNPLDLNTVVVVVRAKGKETLLTKSRAALFVMDRLGGILRLVALVFRPWPKSFLDWIYEVIAKYRYKVFGKLDHCPLPDAHYAKRFIDSRLD
jgi:predicted DCC family thiol-disulfide oxidoreductase YuxK